MSDPVNRRDNETLRDFHAHAEVHTLPKWITDHLKEYADDPEKGHFWDGSSLGGDKKTPTLLLTTKGRKSGRASVMPLIYGKDGDRYVIIGSKGGAPEHPAWYLNMMADPIVEVQVVHDKFQAKAHTATGAERQRLFEMMTKVYPPFPDYQSRTRRELPVVVLEKI
jgi:deazaflavin-dependent oxidoreductase (nitroreductase family)